MILLGFGFNFRKNELLLVKKNTKNTTTEQVKFFIIYKNKIFKKKTKKLKAHTILRFGTHVFSYV